MRALCCPFAITRRERRHLLLVGAQANDCETLSRLQHEASRTRGRDPKFEAPWGLLPDRLLGLIGALEGTSSKEELLRSQLFVPSGTTGRALRCCTLEDYEASLRRPSQCNMNRARAACSNPKKEKLNDSTTRGGKRGYIRRRARARQRSGSSEAARAKRFERSEPQGAHGSTESQVPSLRALATRTGTNAHVVLERSGSTKPLRASHRPPSGQ